MECDYDVGNPKELVLNNVTLTDAGIYACRVTNKIGDVNSSAILTVVQPTITSGQFTPSRFSALFLADTVFVVLLQAYYANF